MAIPIKEVRRVAELARLRFTEEELNRMARELEKMLAYVRKLEEVDISDVEPMSHVHNDAGRLREDEVERRINRDEALSNAPESDGKFFRVPKVIE
ncbi:MAG: Asp-tRNA(Asn)/Glu-tRNA(Gln) amidotransferase subunit GatC [Rhodothermia bacterium]|nr:MAG: Asp-tRNA(Asn)/Glu-tRNA(Gln) amidotransferase subunit GatC [Rhodothermia bacterium]